jgi:hypothetical protein
LAKHETLLASPSTDHVQGRGVGGGVKRAPERLAVDCHHALAALGKALHELGKAGPELLGVEQAEHPAEGVVAGHAVRQSEKLPQETLLQLPEQRHVGAALAATQHRAQGDHQDLPEQVALGIAPA